MKPDLMRNLTNVAKEDLDKEIMKAAVVSELESISLFEKMAEMTRDKSLRMTLIQVIRDKRMLVGEIQAQLMQMGLGPEELLGGSIGPGAV